MKIRAKIFWTLLSMSLLVAMIGALAVNRQYVAATAGAIKEAENIARALGILLSESVSDSRSNQEIIANLHRVQGRDAVLVDINQLILADAVPSDVGKTFAEAPGDEVGATLKDGQVRTFVEHSADSPLPIKQIVVPAKNQSGRVTGAVILEYTPIYDELMQSTKNTTRQVILGGLLSVMVAFLITSFIGRSIATPLRQLTNVATAFAAGETDLPMPPPRKDEIGELANAFDNMVQKRRSAEEELRQARDKLEARVTERTAELAKTNEALHLENVERKRAEVTSRESEEKFRQLAENISDVFWMTSPDLRKVHYISPAYEQVWGRSVDSVYAKPYEWGESILPEERERVHTIFSQLAGDETSASAEYRILRPDGTVRWIFSRGFQVRDAAGKVIRIAGVATDITERKQALALLMESQQRLALARESAHIGIWDWDVVANKLVWDAQMYELYGIREQDFSGAYEAWQKGLHPEDRERGDAAIHAALDGTKDFHIEFRVVWPDGAVRNIEARAEVHRAGDGSAIRMIGVNWDITARKRLEGQLLQSQKMETVGKLAGGIAHEFNSILTAIMGQSELLLADLPSESPLTKNAIEISKAAGRAATLTRQLLAYGRKQLLQPENIDLNQVVTSMEGMFHHLMGDSVDTQIIPASDLHLVKADAGQVEQVIMNMAINARDAMPNGGKLTLETANVSFDQESVGRYPELKPGDYVMLAITDTGTGMSEKVKARVFEPFFSTKDIGQGTGLGLATCYGIIKQSGGHISVYSELARGASFKIYLPQVEQEAKSSAPRLDSPDLPRGTETILLVEDDPALLEMAATLLKRLGYTVLAAGNGIEALSLKHRRDTGHIDLLFTDVVMPHMSGKELADRVRTLYPHTRILFTSAYTENAIVHQGALDKGVALLQKPFTPSALARKIREVIDAEHISAKPVRPTALEAALKSS
jgi:PAS domain S-box-containing protein